MRKIFLTLAMGAIAMSYSVAQDNDEVASMDAEVLTSKKGVPILPTTDAWGLSIGGNNVIDFIGSVPGGFGSSANSFNFVNGGQQIRVKMFKDASTAYRAGININYSSTSDVQYIGQAGAAAPTAPAQAAQVEDKMTSSSMEVELMAGIEMRRGKGRVQGYYGGQASLRFGGGNTDKYTYGNGFDGTNNADLGDNTLQTDFGGNLAAGQYRVTKNSTSGGFGIGAAAFVGVEYFFAPQMSIGGEFTWGLSVDLGAGKQTEEREYSSTGSAVTETYELAKASGSFNIGTDNLGGDVMINFYF